MSQLEHAEQLEKALQDASISYKVEQVKPRKRSTDALGNISRVEETEVTVVIYG